MFFGNARFDFFKHSRESLVVDCRRFFDERKFLTGFYHARFVQSVIDRHEFYAVESVCHRRIGVERNVFPLKTQGFYIKLLDVFRNRRKDVIKEGMPVTIDFGCKYKGYCSDITRTFAFGDPGNDFKDVYEAVLQANYKGIEAVRAGVKASDVDKAARDYLKSKGLDNYFTHSTGHGVGVEIHEHPFENATSETVLKKNMVVTVEPGVYMEGLYGVRVEDLIIVENDGCNVISRLDKKLLIL